ncbi:heterokaryon incompatibility protein-domain-containing protein [Leptodontidium sp. MPI-SDFR-AT-0119]|nr:heterokaryon incompatibility protein-domain-containing protein [Leptodontidium sp. MPI-SDFR-AT-0119]
MDGLRFTLMRSSASPDRAPSIFEQNRTLLLASLNSGVSHIQSPPYIYKPMRAKTEIRIITLLPPPLFAPHEIECTISTAKLSSKPIYEALSYVWGKPVFDRRVYIGDKELNITASLATALQQLRYRDRPRRLWVDAISINQKDNAEKTSQIPLMAQIYGQATSVIGWLGEKSIQTTATIQTLLDLGSLELVRMRASIQYQRHGETSSTRGELGILQRMFGMNTSSLFMKRQPELKTPQKLVNETIRDQHMTHQPLSLFDLVSSNLNRRCANDSDRIYALLGLPRADNDLAITVNYNTKVEDLYTEFALSYLRKNSLKPLHYAGQAIKSPPGQTATSWTNTTLPSWVPDWRNIYLRVSLCSQIPSTPIFSTATDLPPSITIDASSPPSIGIAGRILDTVKHTITTFAGLDPTEIPKADLGNRLLPHPELTVTLGRAYLQGNDNKPYPTGEDPERAFTRTLLLDNRVPVGNFTLPNTATQSPSPTPDSTPNPASKSNLNEETIWTSYLSAKQAVLNPDKSQSVYEWRIEQKAYTAAARATTKGRGFFVTERGYIGLGPVGVKRGDIVIVFDGAETPFVIRRVDEGRREVRKEWVLGGDCYLHGFMNGESLRGGFEDGKQVFWII